MKQKSFSYRNGQLHAERVSLEHLADELGTPLYVYSQSAFESSLGEFKRHLRTLDRFTICYALKANSNLAIIQLMRSLGAGADLVSGGELERARLAQVPAENIVFSGVGKTPGEIRSGLLYQGQGITSFHVESIPELLMINEVAQTLGDRKARVALRFNPNIDAKTHPYISTGLKKNKFGLSPAEIQEVLALLPRLVGVELAGMSIHIGSQLTSLRPLREAFSLLAREVLRVEKSTGRELDFVDLGGGLGICYSDEKPPSIEDYCREVVRAFGPRSAFRSRLRVLIEPGRVLSGNSGLLLSSVLYRKIRPSKDFLILDAAMNDLMRPALYGSYHEALPVIQAHARRKKKKVDLVGPVCESGDCFGSDRPMPESLDTGDLVALMSAGAYGMSMSSNYNSRPRPAEVLVSGDQWRVIRDRERIEDLVRGEHL
jgi:diaminopimelate decarboxylase